jgi:hypothetical protein
LLDRLNPIIAELTEPVGQEAEKCPEAQRPMTHPGVGLLTALAFVLVIGPTERFRYERSALSQNKAAMLEKVENVSPRPASYPAWTQ